MINILIVGEVQLKWDNDEKNHRRCSDFDGFV